MRSAMLFGNVEIINICGYWFIHRCLKVLSQRVNTFLSKERRDGWNDLPIICEIFSQAIRCDSC